jgi:hypothetical protein
LWAETFHAVGQAGNAVAAFDPSLCFQFWRDGDYDSGAVGLVLVLTKMRVRREMVETTYTVASPFRDKKAYHLGVDRVQTDCHCLDQHAAGCQLRHWSIVADLVG